MTPAQLQLHHHVIVFHRDLDGLRDIWPLHEICARLDVDGIGAGAKALRLAPGLAGTDIEFPAVPGTADDFAQTRIFYLAGIGRLREPDQRALTQGGTLMRAAVQETEEFTLDVEDRNRATLESEKFSRTRRQLADGSNDVTRHACYFERP